MSEVRVLPGARFTVSVGVFSYGQDMSNFPIEVIRSKRRTRTVQASLRNGRLQVRVPEGLDPDEEADLIRRMQERVQRKVSSQDVDLTERVRELARRYALPLPASIEWSSRQMRRWGSCSTKTRHIRISNRLASMPDWVLDSVLIHELAHLEEPNHGPRFQELVGRYELTERAKGYLMAVEWEPQDPDSALSGRGARSPG